MPLCSIVTTVYNNEKYIKSAINSVLSQGFDDLEYIVVDDGSTDNTPQILDEIASTDERIKVVRQKNQWIYAGFNKGISMAKGEYVYILNSDDTIVEDSLIKLAAIVKKYKPDVIYTPIMVHVCDEKQNIRVYDKLNHRKLVDKEFFLRDKDSFRDNWIRLCKMKLTENQANLYRRELMLAHPFRNDVYGADNLFNLSIANDIKSAFVMKDPVYNFFQYGNSQMNASVGKYYGYEHNMFNEFYSINKELLQKWNRYDDAAAEFCIKKRLADYSIELKTLCSPKCNMSLEEKIRKILKEYIEEWIYKEAKAYGLEEEFEARTLSGIRQLLCCDETLSQESDIYFLYELLDGLLKYEKTEKDYKNIENAITNKENPYKLGKIFYEKIKDKERF